MTPTLYQFRTDRIKGNGRIRMRLAIMFFITYVALGIAYAKPHPQQQQPLENDACIVNGYFYDANCEGGIQ